MKKITAEEFANIIPNLDSDSIIVDVRELEEYEDVHIENSINIPLSSIGKGIENLKKFQTIYLICESGGRSQYANEVLKSTGIESINVSGGLSVIKKLGIDLVKSA